MIYERPVQLLQRLIQFDTTNPPGQEAACIGYIRGLLDEAGVPSTLLARDPDRPNLVARLKGRGEAPPLLLYGHVDVVPTAHQPWSRAPFGGELIDGYVWGRGAIDMKGGVAMMVAAFLRAQAEGPDLPGDVILTILSDEESGGEYGARYVTETAPELFEGVRYAIGEFGGFALHIGSQKFYPIQVAEKQHLWLRLTVRGEGGHGSLPVRGGAMAAMGRVLGALDRGRLPVHITPVARRQIEAVAGALGGVQGAVLRQLLNPALTDFVLSRLGAAAANFEPILRNTVSPTILAGGDRINVIPAEATVDLDCRLLPGFGPDELIAELRPLVGAGVEFEVVSFTPGPPAPNLGLYDTLASILKAADPAGIPIPLLLPGVTDAPAFARLGIQSYGFLPMNLPPELNFTWLLHAADERVPAAAIEFGTAAVYEVLRRFGEARG